MTVATLFSEVSLNRQEREQVRTEKEWVDTSRPRQVLNIFKVLYSALKSELMALSSTT